MIGLRRFVLASDLRSLPVFGRVLARIEKMPELHGKVWQDVRVARLKQSRYFVSFIVLPDRVEVLAVLHGARNLSSGQSHG